MNNYCIYMHKNKINGKVYIGQTCQKPEYRWNHGRKYADSPAFDAAIQEYGWDNFEHIILEDGLSQKEANEKEIYYINFYQSRDREHGYNLAMGGDNREVHDETRQKISDRLKKEWANGTRDREKYSQMMKERWQDPEYREKMLKQLDEIRVLSDDGRRRISEARKAYIAEHGTPTQGKGHTEETKKKLSEQKMGEKNPMYGTHHTQEWKDMMSKKFSKKVRCIETQQVFNSRKEAAAWCGLASAGSITAYINGHKKSAGKHPITGEKLHWENVIEDIKNQDE